MKYTLKYLLAILVITMVFTACVNDDDTIDYGAETALDRNDPLLLVYTPIISFVAGEPSYDLDFLAFIPSGGATSKVELYTTFTDASTEITSEEVLVKSFDVSNGENPVNTTLTYAELKAGITINGAPLPDNEVDIPVGSSWNMSLRPVDGSGTTTFGAAKVTVGVLSPFAGLYKVIESAYYRIGVEQSPWNGTEIFIGSVDANTFSHNDWWGPFAASGRFVFDINMDNTILIPDNLDQLFFSGDDMLTCQEDEASFANVPCATSNILEPSPDGKHIIKLTYGYFTASGDVGAREFYEVLEKIVQ